MLRINTVNTYPPPAPWQHPQHWGSYTASNTGWITIVKIAGITLATLQTAAALLTAFIISTALTELKLPTYLAIPITIIIIVSAILTLAITMMMTNMAKDIHEIRQLTH